MYNPNLMPWDRPAPPMPPGWQPPFPSQPMDPGFRPPQQRQAPGVDYRPNPALQGRPQTGFAPQPLPPMPQMPGQRQPRQPVQMPQAPRPRDRRIRQGSLLQTLGWGLAALAAPEAAGAYLEGRNRGFDQAEDSDYRNYQIDAQRAQWEAQQAEQAEEDAYRDAWARYEAGMGQRGQVQRENEQGESIDLRRQIADANAEKAAASTKATERRAVLSAMGGDIKSRRTALNQYIAEQGYDDYAAYHDRELQAQEAAFSGAINPTAPVAAAPPAPKPRPAPKPLPGSKANLRVEQAGNVKARTNDIPVDNDRQERALRLQEAKARAQEAKARADIAIRERSQAFRESGVPASTRYTQGQQNQRAAASRTASAKKDAAKKAAPRRMTESQTLAEQARKSGMDVATWKRFANLGIAPGPQASATLDFYMKNGLIKPNDAEDVTKGYYIDTRSPWRQNFMDEQARWKSGKNRWKDGRMERVPPRGSDEEVDAFLSRRGR